MHDAAPLAVFAVLVFGIIVLPGMDMAFVAASALLGGRPAGFAAVGGIVAGGAVHVAAGALGLGLLLQHAPAAFNALLLAGAAYLFWLGLGLLRSSSALLVIGPAAPRGAWQTFGRAAATCLLNPKAYVFTVAVVPPFLRVAPEAIVGRVVALGAIVTLTQAAVYGAVVVGATGLRGWLADSASRQVAAARAVGALFVAMAAWTLWQGWRG